MDAVKQKQLFKDVLGAMIAPELQDAPAELIVNTVLGAVRSFAEKEGKPGLIAHTTADIEAALTLLCCHVSGTHDPVHFQERRYVCEYQMRDALTNLVEKLGIDPVTKSKSTCGWCADYPEKRAGEGLHLSEGTKKRS